jgi:formylglycine-generating enzyme required for sulfatase activity
MVLVTPRDVPIAPGDPRAAYCVDRYEAVLMDSEGAGRVPPYYTPSRKAATATAKMWESLRFEMGDPEQQAVPLPALPAWMLAKDFIPKAVVRKDATPNGHVSGEQAALACRTAGKRLCTHGEWRSACRGARGEMFPYGPDYVQGKCNVFREAHPAAILHGKASIGHSDPRLNRVTYRGRALLMKTGDSPDCKSRWGDDAIYDMVGNLDEWLDDPEGSFAGGFYARASKKGCDWRTSAHANDYSDYSTGVRCCADLP